MKKILIIGGNSFIAQNFVNSFLLEKDHNCKLFVLSVTQKQSDTNSNAVYLSGDYYDKSFLENVFMANEFSHVISFACTTYPANETNASYHLVRNSTFMINLLDLMRIQPNSKLIYLSSGGAIYGNTDKLEINEETRCEPISTYGFIKLSSEKLIHFYSRKYALKYIILRPTNVYGPLHYSANNGIINIMIRKMMNNEKITIFGDGNQTKDYLFVSDMVKVIRRVIELGIENQTFNVCSSVTTTVNEVIDSIATCMKKKPELVYTDKLSTDVYGYSYSNKKLGEHIGPFVFTHLMHGVQKTIEWQTK